jgi:hypothetical protein
MIRTTPHYRDLTAEERAALERFATAENKRDDPWRDALSMRYWFHARLWEGGEPGDGSILHGLRNDLGPTWLYDVCDVKPRRRTSRV